MRTVLPISISPRLYTPGICLFVVFIAGCGRMPEGASIAARDLREAESHLVLALAGDVLLSPNRTNRARKELENDHVNYAAMMRPATAFLSSADIALCNLEAPASLEGTAAPGRKWNFRSAPNALGALVTAGFDVISVANNHVLDYGEDAFVDSLKNLSAANLLYTGVSTDGETQQPVIMEAKGIRVAVLAYANVYPGDYYQAKVRPVRATEPRLKRDIPLARSMADVVVVSIHWGREYQSAPSREQTTLGRAMIDLGASVVAGHHPHALQEPEFYKGGLIFYSLGNFLFPQARIRTPGTRLYRVFLDKQGVARVTYIPLQFKAGPWRMAYRPFSITEWMGKRPESCYTNAVAIR